MLGELFFGIFYNLSVWYKLTDRTVVGHGFSLGGLGRYGAPQRCPGAP